MALSDLHRFTPNGVAWAVTSRGITINGDPPVGTFGPPSTARRVIGWFGEEVSRAALTYLVPRQLLIAVICNESAGGETDHGRCCAARREEPGFYTDKATPARVSTGCCQTLLSTARQALRRPDLSSQDLTDPQTSINAAAAYIGSQCDVTRYDPVLVAAAYNAGGLYLEATHLNRWGLRCFPLNTGGYIDRFVLWYNDTIVALTTPP